METPANPKSAMKANEAKTMSPEQIAATRPAITPMASWRRVMTVSFMRWNVGADRHAWRRQAAACPCRTTCQSALAQYTAACYVFPKMSVNKRLDSVRPSSVSTTDFALFTGSQMNPFS